MVYNNSCQVFYGMEKTLKLILNVVFIYLFASCGLLFADDEKDDSKTYCNNVCEGATTQNDYTKCVLMDGSVEPTSWESINKRAIACMSCGNCHANFYNHPGLGDATNVISSSTNSKINCSSSSQGTDLDMDKLKYSGLLNGIWRFNEACFLKVDNNQKNDETNMNSAYRKIAENCIKKIHLLFEAKKKDDLGKMDAKCTQDGLHVNYNNSTDTEIGWALIAACRMGQLSRCKANIEYLQNGVSVTQPVTYDVVAFNISLKAFVAKSKEILCSDKPVDISSLYSGYQPVPGRNGKSSSDEIIKGFCGGVVAAPAAPANNPPANTGKRNNTSGGKNWGWN